MAKEMTSDEIKKLAKKAADDVLGPMFKSPEWQKLMDSPAISPKAHKALDDMVKKQKRLLKEFDEYKKGKGKPLDPKKSSSLERDIDELKSLSEKASSKKSAEGSEADKLIEQLAKQMDLVGRELGV